MPTLRPREAPAAAAARAAATADAGGTVERHPAAAEMGLALDAAAGGGERLVDRDRDGGRG